MGEGRRGRRGGKEGRRKSGNNAGGERRENGEKGRRREPQGGENRRGKRGDCVGLAYRPARYRSVASLAGADEVLPLSEARLWGCSRTLWRLLHDSVRLSRRGSERARERGKELGRAAKNIGGGEHNRMSSQVAARGQRKGTDSAVLCEDVSDESPGLPCEYCWGSRLVG